MRNQQPNPLRLAAIAVCTCVFVNPSTTRAVDFSHDIVPILRQHCSECHTGEAKKGGFSLNDRLSMLAGSENGSMLAIGKSDASYMIELVMSTDPDLQMPPKGQRLTANEIALLRRWIDEGLVWEEGFAFKQPTYEPPLVPRAPELPPATEGRVHPIDRLVDHYWRERGLPRPQRLDDHAFLRRSSLDLIGLLPSPESVERFIEDRLPDRRQRWILGLLKDDVGYADHWLTFWNDLLRNDYSGTGFITGGRTQISRWLYRSLLENKPFDQFTRELIAPPDKESRGFIDGIQWRGEVSAGQTVEIQFAQSVSQSFLGINMKCASCHDSFIDRWKLSDAYGLAAIYSTKPLEIFRCDKATGIPAQATWIFPELGQIDAAASQDERLRQLAELMTSPQNGRFARTLVNRLWYRLMGHGLVHPVDSMQSEPWSQDLLDHLATMLVEFKYDLRKLLAYIASSETYQTKSEVIGQHLDEKAFVFTAPRGKRMTSEQFMDAVWTITGAAPDKYDAPIFRGLVDIATISDQPLTGKWIWGNVDVPPAEPELDEGAEVAEEKKEPAPVQKVIAGSVLLRKTFQLDGPVAMAGAVMTANRAFTLFVNNREVAKDDDWRTVELVLLRQHLKKGKNTFDIYAQGPVANSPKAGVFFEAKIRLDDGQIRTVSSDETWSVVVNPPVLNQKSLRAFPANEMQPANLVKPAAAWTKAIQAQAPYLVAQATAIDSRMFRASLMKNDFLMRTLGRPNRDQIVSMRPNDLTTLEAIGLANGQSFADLLARGAKRLQDARWTSTSELVSYVYRLGLTRDPTAAELAIAIEAVGEPATEQGIQDLLWAICMMPEFQYVR